MKLPWTKAPATENYQDTSYTDALIAALIRQARGRTASTVLTSETGALESAAGLVGRAFAACEVLGDAMYTSALSPQIMELIGRSLLRRGDAVFYMDTSDGLTILPAQTHSIDGGPMPEWMGVRRLPGRTWDTQDAATSSSGGSAAFQNEL